MKKEKVDLNTIQEENEKLNNRIAELEKEKADRIKDPTFGKEETAESRYSRELQRIQAKSAKSKPDTIYYKEVDDHKPLFLYHLNGLRVGKKVGPLHPDNAVNTFNTFAKMGVILSLDMPTPEALEKYKATDEYIKARANFDRERKARLRSRKPSEIAQLTDAIANMTGQKPSEVNKPVLDPSTVKGLNKKKAI